MKKNGFTIIELLFSIIIASFLIMTLTIVLGQTSRARNFAQNAVHVALLKTSLIYSLYHDFAGTFLIETKKNEDESSSAKATADKKEQEPPIVIKRNSENMVEEIRFTTVTAARYQKTPVPTEIIYKLVQSDKSKKLYKIQRTFIVKNQDQSKQKESEPINFLENVTKCTAQFVKVAKKESVSAKASASVKTLADKTPDKGQNSFELVDNWPLLRQGSGGQALNQKETEEKNPQKKEPEQKQKQEEPKFEIPFIKIVISYLPKEPDYVKTTPGGHAEEIFTLFTPLCIYKREIEKQKPMQKVPEKQEVPQKQANDKSTQPSVAEDRAAKTLGSIFKGIK